MKITKKTATQLILTNQVIAVATDTVYGLTAKYNSLLALEEIYRLKKRSEKQPLAILASSISQVSVFIDRTTPGFKKLHDTFWPGGLTLILPALRTTLPAELLGLNHTIGIRIPHHDMLLSLIEKTGPLATTSANLSGEPNYRNVDEIENTFGQEFPIFNEGEQPQNTESTILEYRHMEWHLLRQGAIPVESIARCIDNLAI